MSKQISEKKYTILIVEDAENYSDLLQNALRKEFKEAFVVVVDNAKKAKEVIGNKEKLKELIKEQKDNDSRIYLSFVNKYKKEKIDYAFEISCIVLDMIDNKSVKVMGLEVLNFIQKQRLKGENETTQIVINSGQLQAESLLKELEKDSEKYDGTGETKAKNMLSEKYNVICITKGEGEDEVEKANIDLICAMRPNILHYKILHTKNRQLEIQDLKIDHLESRTLSIIENYELNTNF
ncbi:MAG: hypothetical protein LBI82_06980 [Dysgonamonadaceae bacterium]|jgi:CheY-like chemotaxis protein|nr:hypothetical protein [Dysgonamonadaceae bacterium]